MSLSFLGLLAALGAFTAHPAVPAAVLESIHCARATLALAALATFAFRRRGQLRRLEGIDGTALGDFCAYFWCPALSVSEAASGAPMMGHPHVALAYAC